MSTSPLERDILTHYWVSPDPFPRNNQLIKEITSKFVRCGLLSFDENLVAHGVKEALEPYMEALGEVRLPVQRWVIL